MELDFNLVCDASFDRVFSMVVAAIFFLIFSLGTPLFFAYKLRQLIKERTDIYKCEHTLKVYGILYLTYKPECYYFESVVIFYKLMLWMLMVVLGGDSVNRVLACLFITVGMLNIHVWHWAWKDTGENIFHLVGLILTCLFAGYGLGFQTQALHIRDAAFRQDLRLKAQEEETMASMQVFFSVIVWTCVTFLAAKGAYSITRFCRRHKVPVKVGNVTTRLAKRLSQIAGDDIRGAGEETAKEAADAHRVSSSTCSANPTSNILAHGDGIRHDEPKGVSYMHNPMNGGWTNESKENLQASVEEHYGDFDQCVPKEKEKDEDEDAHCAQGVGLSRDTKTKSSGSVASAGSKQQGTSDAISLAVSASLNLSESDALATDDDEEEESEITPEFHVNEQFRQQHL